MKYLAEKERKNCLCKCIQTERKNKSPKLYWPAKKEAAANVLTKQMPTLSHLAWNLLISFGDTVN